MKKYWLFIITVLLFNSCNSFLEVDPKTSILSDGVIKDESSAKAALNGTYVALRSYYSVDFQSIAYLSGDNVEWTGSQSQIQEFINHRVNPENPTLAATWNGIYQSINRANNLIKALQELTGETISAEAKNSFLGQAYAIRALNYFDLVRVWGGVPIILQPTEKAGDNVGIERSSLEESYSQVLKDLEEAEKLLTNSIDRYGISKQTVWAIKARYYLYQKNWAEAKQYADNVIADGNYELLNPYFSFFKNNVVGTKESVFELYYNANELNPHRGQWQPQTNGGTRQWAPNEALVSLLTTASTGGSRKDLVAKDNQNRWYGNLYYRSPGTDPSYVIRIAELYLIRAEANAQLGNLGDALQDLNKIRQRAELNPKSTSQEKSSVLLWIEEERRLEFALEAHRWFDLVRTGRAKEVLKITEDFRLLLPIPYSQILADPALKQNPGYSS